MNAQPSFDELVEGAERAYAPNVAIAARRLVPRVGAVVYFLRLVIWIVPEFTVDGYHEQLRALHEQIGHEGEFVASASRFLIEATKPG